MSWSISMAGKPEKVAEALEAHGATLTGQSKVEYDAAAPHLAALVRQNYAKTDILVKIEASGHGYTEGGQDVSRQIQVKLEMSYTKLLT